MLANEYEIYHYKDFDLASVGMHHHDYYECLFFISGSVRYLIEGKAYDLRSGDIVLVNASELHQASIIDQTIPYERIVLWLNRDFVASMSTPETNLANCFTAASRRHVLRAEIETQQRIRNLMGQILNLQQYKGYGSELLTRSCLTELLVHLNIEMLNISMQPDPEVRRSQTIEDAISYIGEHLEDQLSIDDLAEHFYLSKFHLSREFRKQTGSTLHHFILQKKLILAKELILQRLPITEVHKRCGFGDYSNFFRAFRNEYDLTPRQFYEQMLKDK